MDRLTRGGRPVVTTRRAGRSSPGAVGAGRAARGLTGAALLVAALALTFRFALRAPSLGATVETGLVLCGFASVLFMWATWKHTRRVSDLLLMVAAFTLTIEDLAFFAAPAMLGSRSSTFGAVASLTARVAVAVVFAGAALVARRGRLPRPRLTLGVVAMAAIFPIVVGTAALLVGGLSVWVHSGRDVDLTPQSVVLTIAAICLLSAAAIGFLGSADRQPKEPTAGLWEAACILLAAAWGYCLLAPGVTPTSVSGCEILRAGAYGLILIAALRTRAQRQREEAAEAAARERRRVARDLHDGLAQDLAFIAAHGERLARRLGPDHPIVIAARRALTVSRGAIVDLSASHAPTAAGALRAVADELSVRHGVRVDVKAGGEDLSADEREAAVRIAREAIVNAINHGGAQNIAVSLHTDHDGLRLAIVDDGRGLGNAISRDPHIGQGTRAMRERAEAIGGELTTRSRAEGGTAVEVVVT